MSRTYRFRLLGLLALTAVAHVGAPQSSDLLVQTVPVGLKPLGVATGPPVCNSSGDWHLTVVVANSGENSVSIFQLRPDPASPATAPYRSVTLSATIQGIPSPYGVARCNSGVLGRDGFLVTSPSANSVSFIDAAKGTVVATVAVGRQPYSAACSLLRDRAFVSNNGDNSLAVIDTRSLQVIQTVPSVPGGRGLHGVVEQLLSDRVWVAGTDLNVVSVVDWQTPRVLASLPFRAPTSLMSCLDMCLASAGDNAVYEVYTSDFGLGFTIRNIPTPQDLIGMGLGNFISTGPGNSLVWIPGNLYTSLTPTTIPGIPGAAGLAGYSATPQPPDPCYPSRPPHLLFATSPDSNALYVLQRRASMPDQFHVANAASSGNLQIAPGSLASIYASTGVSQSLFAGSLPLPTALGAVRLQVGGTLNFDAVAGWVYSPTGAVQAPLLFVGPNQVNLQVPPGLAPGSAVPVQLIRADGSSLLSTLSSTPSSPGIFTITMNGRGQAAALNQDNTVNFGTNPAKRGSVIQIFASGAGETTAALAAGEAAPATGNPLVLTKVQPTVTIGGKSAKVQFSGMAPGFVGLWQINAEIPQDVTPGMALPLVITAAGVQSNTVTIAVQ
jgi:uncharacterized protein (TIGR03437 family)